MAEQRKTKNSAAKIAANNRYTAKMYDEIKVRVPKGEKDVLKQYAKDHYRSLNGLILDAVYTYLANDKEFIKEQEKQE